MVIRAWSKAANKTKEYGVTGAQFVLLTERKHILLGVI